MKFLIFLLTFAVLAVILPAESSAAGPVHQVSVATGPEGNTAPDASAYEVQAQRMITWQNWTGALLVTREAISMYPDIAELHAIRGFAFLNLGQYSDAVHETTLAIDLDPRAVRYTSRGYAYLALRNYPSALADAEAGIAGNPADPANYIIKALALNGQGSTVEAINAIDAAIVHDKANALAWHVKGIVLLARGDCPGAHYALARAFSLNPDYDLPWPGFSGIQEDRAALNAACVL
jgi:tetratricopeptide (TPR) repeat protein